MAKKKNNTYNKQPIKKKQADELKLLNNEYDIFNIAALVYILWAMIVSPLWLENQYFNQTEAKGHAFIAGVVVAFVMIAIAVITKKTVKPLLPKKNVTDISIVVFGIMAVLSSLLADHKLASMFGYKGWWIGGFQMLAFTVLVIFLSNKAKWSNSICGTIMGVGFIVYLMDIMHGAGVDFLYLHQNMLEGQIYGYLSTLGNIDWHIGFITLTMPILAIMYMKNTDKEWDNLYRAYLFMACIGITFNRTDGIYVGLGLCALFAVPFVFSKVQHLERFLHIIFLFGLSLLIVIYIPWFEVIKNSVDGITAVFSKPLIAWMVTIVGIAGSVLVHKFMTEIAPRAARMLTIVCEIILAAIIIYFFVDTIMNFSDEWGSQRGMIWKYVAEYFSDMPLFNKLIGMGPETLFEYNAPLNETFGGIVQTYHSDFLQFIVTNGIIGCGAWIVMWGSLIVRQLKKGSINSEAFPFFVAIIAYLGQSLVFTAEGVSWPMLIAVMGLYLSYQNRYETIPE